MSKQKPAPGYPRTQRCTHGHTGRQDRAVPDEWLGAKDVVSKRRPKLEPRGTHNETVGILGNAVLALDPLNRLAAADALVVRVDEKPTNATRTPPTGNGAFILHDLKEDPRPRRELMAGHPGPEGSVSARSLTGSGSNDLPRSSTTTLTILTRITRTKEGRRQAWEHSEPGRRKPRRQKGR